MKSFSFWLVTLLCGNVFAVRMQTLHFGSQYTLLILRDPQNVLCLMLKQVCYAVFFVGFVTSEIHYCSFHHYEGENWFMLCNITLLGFIHLFLLQNMENCLIKNLIGIYEFIIRFIFLTKATYYENWAGSFQLCNHLAVNIYGFIQSPIISTRHPKPLVINEYAKASKISASFSLHFLMEPWTLAVLF